VRYQKGVKEMKKVPTLETATNDEIFTEFMHRLLKVDPYHIYFIDRTTVEPFPTWSVYHDGTMPAMKEIKEK
jgi:hypothetical protein